MTLDDLLDQACTRTLTEPEIQRMCTLADEENRSQSVLLRLISAGTSAGRTNLSAAKTLTSRHAPRHHDRREVRAEKAAEVVERERLGKAEKLPFSLTSHACERFIERHLSHETADKAMEFLVTEARTATPLKERAINGEQQWISESGIRFVMRHDSNHTLPVCVTVLPKESREGRHQREGKPLRTRQ